MDLLELLTGRRQIDAMFTPTDQGEVFSFRGRRRVLLPQAEAAAVRQALYVLVLLPYATTIPLLLLLVGSLPGPILGASGTIWPWITGAAIGVLLSMGVLIRYLYVSMVYQRFPEA